MNSRAQKRKRFDEDFSYLSPRALPDLGPAASGEDAQPRPAEEDPGTFPVPSAVSQMQASIIMPINLVWDLLGLAEMLALLRKHILQ